MAAPAVQAAAAAFASAGLAACPAAAPRLLHKRRAPGLPTRRSWPGSGSAAIRAAWMAVSCATVGVARCSKPSLQLSAFKELDGKKRVRAGRRELQSIGTAKCHVWQNAWLVEQRRRHRRKNSLESTHQEQQQGGNRRCRSPPPARPSTCAPPTPPRFFAGCWCAAVLHWWPAKTRSCRPASPRSAARCCCGQVAGRAHCAACMHACAVRMWHARTHNVFAARAATRIHA